MRPDYIKSACCVFGEHKITNAFRMVFDKGVSVEQSISTIKLLMFGLLTWLIPFLVSLLLIDRDGRHAVPVAVFKSLMMVVGSAVGAWLLVIVFRRRPVFKTRGATVGLLWLGINIGLDLLILIPMTKMGLTDYFGEIALRYLVMPIMAIAIDIATKPFGGNK